MLNGPAQNHRTATLALPCSIFCDAWEGFLFHFIFFLTFERKLWEVVPNHEIWVPCGMTSLRQAMGNDMLDWSTVHEATLLAYIRESAYVRSHVGCGRVHQTLLLHAPQIFQDAKAMQINKIFNKVKFDLSSLINPPNNRDLNQGILHLWTKFGGPSLNRWWVIARTSSKWGKFWLWS